MPELFFRLFYRGVSISWCKPDFFSLKKWTFLPWLLGNPIAWAPPMFTISRLIKNLVDLGQNESSVYVFILTWGQPFCLPYLLKWPFQNYKIEFGPKNMHTTVRRLEDSKVFKASQASQSSKLDLALQACCCSFW